MRTHLRRRLTIGTAIIASVLVGSAACGTPSEPTSPARGTSSGATGGASGGSTGVATGPVKRLWKAAWRSGGEGPPDDAKDVVISPDGLTSYVVGSGPVIAYATASGQQRWTADDPAFTQGLVSGAVSADGSLVFVTGPTTKADTGENYTTVALDASSGKPLWRKSYTGPGAGADTPAAIVAAGDLVVVNGTSAGSGTGVDFATVAYDAKTGTQKWVARYDGAAHGDEGWFPSGIHSLAANQAGSMVYVTGGSQGAGGADYATVAYEAATGTRKWVATYSDPSKANDVSAAVAVSPDGVTVVTTGASESKTTKTDSATVAYNAATGKQAWVKRYNGPASQNEGTGAIAFAPDGQSVFVTGTSEGATQGKEDFITIAYGTTDGTQRWAVRWDGKNGGDDNAADLATGPDGTTLVVTGKTVPAPMQDEYATVGYDPATGKVLWTATFASLSANESRASEAHAVAISKDGTIVVTGVSGVGYGTVAYRATK
ncbi:hypothetical protein N865_00270 [Intrasporangium oryzae NRRL B-24470]|uniref:Pyrrolo-quinoline quinone repeat domain-containing protein n=1 Tax=Intrasporangium oryzae NRRL B-24470 TaxID=1386089 RepID=W9G843_9MICO|nr:PQQ-binding-like beta-propeller repeat protein [Intrasporangium oryzae]EWT02210.1 hypothetical protein N865_00270 [Intrasporangium oryzae NRRL B-24470]